MAFGMPWPGVLMPREKSWLLLPGNRRVTATPTAGPGVTDRPCDLGCETQARPRSVRSVKLLQELARPRGVEPLTPRSVVWCSIQLSYGRVATARTGCPGAGQLLQPDAATQDWIVGCGVAAALTDIRWGGMSPEQPPAWTTGRPAGRRNRLQQRRNSARINN